jgi:hypothetical protein
MGSSPTDIITYIGVPLAVLGVLPMIYTCINSLLTLKSIQRILERNFIDGFTRSSLLSGIVEIEIPRKSLHPLDRDDPDYFRMSAKQSSLKGGTWTLLNWRELNIGSKVYRLQYHDELGQPQAEIDFEALIAFLLDRGAVPAQQGFADLRSSGLWTPTGTKLLLSPCTSDGALSVSTSEDSDGILSLQLEWRPEWDKRGAGDLPPYWTRIHPPWDGDKDDDKVEEEKASNKEGNTSENYPSEVQANEVSEDEDSDKLIEVASTIEKRAIPTTTQRSSIRVRIGTEGLEESYYEDSPKQRPTNRHLKTFRNEPNPTSTWFSSSATALRAHDGGLWAYAIPEELVSLSRRETVPCGIMVLLGVIAEEAVPTWRTPSNVDDEIERYENQVKTMARLRAIGDEMMLPAQERAKVSQARIRQEMMDMSHSHQRKRLAEEKKRELEIQEALRSQRLAVHSVADANRKWMVEKGHVPEGTSLALVVEKVLWEMMHSQERTKKIVDMLEAWKGWADNGGMTKTQYLELRDQQLEFAYASCVLCIIRDSAGAGAGNVVSDMQECLRMWKRVRLG